MDRARTYQGVRGRERSDGGPVSLSGGLMPTRSTLTRRGLLLLLGFVAFGVAFAQRPGRTVFDTRIELSADPTLFLHRVADVWSSTGDLGHVQGGQFVGYLFPMAPWFAFVQWTGIPMWIGQRLWIGALLAVSAWGVVRLLDVLYTRQRGLAHLAAGLLYAANPYVVVWLSRGSAGLIAYACAPWLLYATARGLRASRDWRWPALLGLLLAASGGGINAAFVLWVLPAVPALMLYELVVLRRGRAALLAFAWRGTLCGVLGALWWAVPLLVQVHYGSDFLSFTESPSSVWATTSMPESLRLLGYWVLYLGLGGEPVVPATAPYLFSAPVIVASFLVPVLAFAGLWWTRTWRYAPFFCLLAVGALLAMAAGFPGGTPLHRALLGAYGDLEPLRFLRTSYKAAPLVALALAGLGGVAVHSMWLRSRAATAGRPQRRVLFRSAIAAGTAGLIVLFGLPLFAGHAIDRTQAYGHIPASWRAGLAAAERHTPPNQRMMVVPGALFGSYRWGQTVSTIAPALARRPVLVRELVPYASPEAAQLQATVDGLIQQGRLVPGQLDPLLALMAVGQVIVNTDLLPLPSGALDAAGVARALRGQPGLTRPAATYGASRNFGGSGQPPLRLPELRRYQASKKPRSGIVRIESRGGGTVLDGDANGTAELAADGRLSTAGPLFYSADLDRTHLQTQANTGATLVFTDSNRRRVMEPNLLRADVGPTLGADDPITAGWPSYHVFPHAGTAAETVARYSGVEYLRSALERGTPLNPAERAFAALDGRLNTAWRVPPGSAPANRDLEIGFRSPRRVKVLRIYPVGGISHITIALNGDAPRAFRLHSGWNTLRIGGRNVQAMRFDVPAGSPAGIAEVRIDGFRTREALRLPTDLADRARGLDLSHSAEAVLLARTTADFPGQAGGQADAEHWIMRDITLPAGRSFRVRGWANVSRAATEGQLDRLAGVPRGWSFTSSGRYQGMPGNRAASAFDGRVSSSWVAPIRNGQTPWVRLRAPRPLRVDRLWLRRGPARYGEPAVVRLVTDGTRPRTLRIGPTGEVALPHAVRTRDIELSVRRVRRVRGRSPAPATVAIAEVAVPGVHFPALRSDGRFASRCGALRLYREGGGSATLQVSGMLSALNAGTPLRVTGCGSRAQLALPSGASRVVAPAGGALEPTHIALFAPAPVPLAQPPLPGTAIATGNADSGVPNRVALHLHRPAWLVLGDSYSRGWKASCTERSGNKRDLGPPVPINGYANGWPVGPTCRQAQFAFAPQRLVNAGYAVSGAACLIMLLVLVAYAWLRRTVGEPQRVLPRGRQATSMVDSLPDRLRRARWPTALIAGAATAAAFAFVAGYRAAAAFGIATTVLLLVGIRARRMITLATLGLLAIPLLYVLDPAPRPSGLSFTYASHYLVAHWVALGAVLLVAVTAALDAGAFRRMTRVKPSTVADHPNTNCAGRVVAVPTPDASDLSSPRPR
jgi:arabinofuranan 3-O-arabinosyltransferase